MRAPNAGASGRARAADGQRAAAPEQVGDGAGAGAEADEHRRGEERAGVVRPP